MSESTLLRGTMWEFVYKAFGSAQDDNLCTWMSTVGLVYTAVVGAYSLFWPAPYGRYATPTFGPTVNAKIAWIVQESPAFVVPVILMITTANSQLTKFTNVCAMSLFLLHYFQRSCIFPFAIAGSGKEVPVFTMLSAVVFCSYNGFLQGHHLANVLRAENSLFVYIGAPLFLLGMGINISHDRMLIALRKDVNTDSSGRKEYKIPRGGLFEYISGANYFGEIIEWWSLALVTRSYPQFAFAVFSSTFLGIRAYHHHHFYKEKFGETYPPSRKAIIPFVI